MVSLGPRPSTYDPLRARLSVTSLESEASQVPLQRALSADARVDRRAQDARNWMLDSVNWHGIARHYKTKVEMCWEVIDNRWRQREEILKFQRGLRDSERQKELDEDQYDWDVEDLVTGPAVVYAWISNVITWLGFFLITMLTAYFTEVNKDTGIADTLLGWNWGFFWALCIWLLTTLPPLFCEFVAALHVMPAQANAFGRPDVFPGLGKGQWTFRLSLSVLLFISFLQRTDVFTAAMFVGRVFKSTHSCNRNISSLVWFFEGDATSPSERIWQYSINRNLFFKQVLGSFTFWQFTFATWIMMLVQFFYAVFYAMPVSPDFRNEPDFQNKCFTSCKKWVRKYKLVRGVHKIKTKMRSFYAEDEDEEVNFPRRRALYHTLAAAFTSHGRCLQALGDSGRMMSIQWLDDAYCVEASKEWDLQKIVLQMQRANWRYFLFAIQAIMAPHLQVFFYGAQKNLLNSGARFSIVAVDGFTTLSVWISVIFGVKYIFWEMKILHQAWTRLEGALNRDIDKWLNTHNTLRKWEAIKLRRHGYCTIFLGLCISVIAGILLVDLVVKE